PAPPRPRGDACGGAGGAPDVAPHRRRLPQDAAAGAPAPALAGPGPRLPPARSPGRDSGRPFRRRLRRRAIRAPGRDPGAACRAAPRHGHPACRGLGGGPPELPRHPDAGRPRLPHSAAPGPGRLSPCDDPHGLSPSHTYVGRRPVLAGRRCEVGKTPLTAAALIGLWAGSVLAADVQVLRPGERSYVVEVVSTDAATKTLTVRSDAGSSTLAVDEPALGNLQRLQPGDTITISVRAPVT